LENEPEAPPKSSPPESAKEEPVPAVPTRDTTPVWAHTDPAAPPQVPNETFDTADEAQAMPARAMAKGVPAEIDEGWLDRREAERD